MSPSAVKRGRSERRAETKGKAVGAEGRGSLHPPRRSSPETAPPDDTGSRPLSEEIVVVLCLALAAGFYGWVARGAQPWKTLYPDATDKGLFRGLPTAILVALAGATVLVAVLRLAGSRAEPWKGRLALAAGLLYLAAAAAPVRGPALLLAPPLALAALFGLGRRVVRADGLVLLVHAGLLVTAIGFYHRWSYYAMSWAAFTDSVKALIAVLS